MPEHLSRTSFLRRSAGASAAVAAGAWARAAIAQSQQPANGTIPQRRFGRANVTISALGLGGHHLGNAATQADATNIVAEAIDGGITFFDNAWEYNDHRSEEWMGNALRGKRDKIFLMTKVCTHGRDATLAMRMLEESLRRLQTDHLDLWQIHAVVYDNDPGARVSQGRGARSL